MGRLKPFPFEVPIKSFPTFNKSVAVCNIVRENLYAFAIPNNQYLPL